jgi:hypothetical protein
MTDANLLIERLKIALENQKTETARRLGSKALSEKPSNELVRLLHQAYRRLSDYAACRAVLEDFSPQNDSEKFELLLLQAEDSHVLSGFEFYQTSKEAAAGFSSEEYAKTLQARSVEFFESALTLAGDDPERRRVLARTLQRTRSKPLAREWGLEVDAPPVAAPCSAPVAGTGRISGKLKFPDGQAAAHVLVTLGLKLEVIFESDPRTQLLTGSEEYEVHYGPQRILTAKTDDEGRFSIGQIPQGTHEFLSITLDPLAFDIPTRFLAQGIAVADDNEIQLDLTIDEWRSTPSESLESPFPERLERNGARYRLRFEQKLRNPFHHSFPRQLVRMALPLGVTSDPERLLILSAPAHSEPLQVSGREVLFFADLPQVTQKVVALYEAETAVSQSSAPQTSLQPVPEADGKSAIIDTGRASFRIPWGQGEDALPPLLSVRGEDGVWRGKGRFRLPAGVSILSRCTTILESGPLLLEVEVAYTLSNRAGLVFRFTAHRNEAYLLVHEISLEMEEASFEFSLAEFSGGRGYLHWASHPTARRWSTLTSADRELARLQESIAWWCPPQGFAYAMTPDGIEEKDFIGVFSRNRGEWIDRKFERLTHGPIDADGKENRELDWPWPEMVGSTISMITAHTDAQGDAFFKFGLFNGERQWGILVSSLDRNDGPVTEISEVQHKNSSPRLDAFKTWKLDEPDQVQRPSVMVQRKNLRALRRKKQSPLFGPIWEKIASNRTKLDNWFSFNKAGQTSLPQNDIPGTAVGPVMGMNFAVDADPRVAWLMKRELVNAAGVYAKAILSGRDHSDTYSPVGGRPITLWAENYDLVAASGVFTPEEERLVRAFLMLMGHMYSEADFINWHYNSRNANFESDRVDIVGTIGLTFRGNPDADGFIRHTSDLMERALNTYCAPGSGKWYENPACYYLQSLKCRTNLAFHLAEHGGLDATTIPRFKDFLRWAILLTMPAAPRAYEAMAGRCDAATYCELDKIRRIPPIGDHAYLGRPYPEHFAIMAKLYRKRDPKFADELLWIYRAGGASGEAYANYPLLFASLDEEDLRPQSEPEPLVSRRLEAFGAVFRDHFNQPDEFYMLLKQGPGGYRYQNTEGSLILFADGKPLLYDGGEAGETWRHSTLSFYDTHLPLEAGHVERFHSFAGLEFVQGVHPCVNKPGEIVDHCHHSRVEIAYQRMAEMHPANARSVFWVSNEYLILHDELKIDPAIPSHWHLQVVAESETGDSQTGYLFQGRHGTDLQVLLPGQRFLSEECTRLPHLENHLPLEKCFATRHLHLQGDRPGFYLAVLRPLSAGKEPLSASLLPGGLGVTGAGVEDRFFFKREGLSVREPALEFSGRYGAILRRPDSLQLSLLDGSSLQVGDVRIESDGPTVFLNLSGSRAELTVEGDGKVKLNIRQKKIEAHVRQGRSTFSVDV